MRANFTDIVILLDSSGSMDRNKQETISGINHFIEEQKGVPGEANVTLVTFSYPHSYHYQLQNVPVASVGKITFKPAGGTALADAWARLIDERGSYYSTLPEFARPENVIFVVVTDGEENSSRTYTAEDVSRRVKLQEQTYKWQFVYLGANQIAETVAAAYAVPLASSATFNMNEQSIDLTYKNLARSVVNYRTKVSASVAFDDLQKSTILGKTDINSVNEDSN